MPIYNLIDYSDTFVETSGSLYQYYRDEPALNDNGNITDLPNDNNNRTLFKYKQQTTGQTRNNGTKDVQIMVPLKYLRNF